jgi:hypothetical protein
MRVENTFAEKTSPENTGLSVGSPKETQGVVGNPSSVHVFVAGMLTPA